MVNKRKYRVHLANLSSFPNRINFLFFAQSKISLYICDFFYYTLRYIQIHLDYKIQNDSTFS